MDKIKRVKELNTLLQKASYAYYGLDKPIMSDKEYDDLYDELASLEKETECIFNYITTNCGRQITQNHLI